MGKNLFYKENLILLSSSLFTIYGILFLGWDFVTIILLYWIETGIIGFFTLLRILIAQGKEKTKNSLDFGYSSKITLALFFLIHFSGFMFAHLFFLWFILFFSFHNRITPLDIYEKVLLPAYPILLLIFFNHFYSFMKNFIYSGEYKNRSPQSYFTSPYKRVIIIHLTILSGFFLYAFIPTKKILVILLVLFKTIAEVIEKEKENKI